MTELEAKIEELRALLNTAVATVDGRPACIRKSDDRALVRLAINVLPTLLDLAASSLARGGEGESEARTWRCFHCDEVFTTVEAAREHFGQSEIAEPGCCINLAEYRRMEENHERHLIEDDECSRQFYAMRADHAVALRREEEKGYERGLRDATSPGSKCEPAGASVEELCKRLLAEEPCDIGPFLDDDTGPFERQRGTRLVNPDGLKAASLIRRLERERDEAIAGRWQPLQKHDEAALLNMKNRATTAEAEAESWKSQFHSAAEAASMYVEFYEQHHADFDPAGNYIPHSQIDGDLRAAEAEAERLRAENTDLSHREKVRSEAINKALHDANERAESAQARADLANKLFDQREEYLAGLDARNSELRADNERLREALKPFADRASRYDPDENDNNEPDWCTAAPSIRIGDLRRARTALEGKTDER